MQIQSKKWSRSACNKKAAIEKGKAVTIVRKNKGVNMELTWHQKNKKINHLHLPGSKLLFKINDRHYRYGSTQNTKEQKQSPPRSKTKIN